MHYCFVWKKWQWLVSPWMEANLCLNTGGCRVVRGGLSGGRWRGQAVYWELDQWQVNPHRGKLFIFVKAFLLHSHGGPRSARKANDSLNMQRKCYTFKNIFFPSPSGTSEKIFAWAWGFFFYFLRRGLVGASFMTRVSSGCNRRVFCQYNPSKMRKVHVLFL